MYGQITTYELQTFISFRATSPVQDCSAEMQGFVR
jgi:hypothetical protein